MKIDEEFEELKYKFESDYELVTRQELLDAYFDCRKHKRGKKSCIEFEMREAENLIELWRELNNGTYVIGYSDTFIVTRPKHREVFAADFKDRIVHHLIIRRTINLFEDFFIEDTYNCRVGKGTMYGIDRLQDAIKEVSNNYTEDCYILKCDIYSFFMSIDKRILWDMLRRFLNEKYTGPDKDWVLYMVKMIVMHRPELRCHNKGDKRLWKFIAKNKSLFTNGEWLGMAIGNLTSQIFINFFLSMLDYYVTGFREVRYGRYVDDFYIVSKSKEQLLELLSSIRKFLMTNLKITLHPDKWYLQHYSKGVNFIGSTCKFNRTYPGKRTVYNFEMLAKSPFDGNIDKFIHRYNSYTGFLIHHASYKIRRRVYEMLPKEITSMTYIDSNFAVLKIRNKYKTKNILLNKLNKQNYGKN